jgi:hypothetical protein
MKPLALLRRRARHSAPRVDDDATWRPVVNAPDDRPWYEMHTNLRLAQTLYRTNPLAARIVGMTTDFVIGRGLSLSGDAWVSAFWHHPQNRMDLRVYRWCDELTRSGELFIMLSSNPVDGMQYVREVPAQQIDAIETDPHDLERELSYHQLTADPLGLTWLGSAHPDALSADQLMLHLAINRPLGETRGYSDLHQIAKWLGRYGQWLEDRVRINRFKGAYLWHVQIDHALPAQLEAKRAQYSRIPKPGSLIISDASEKWSAVQPHIDADDAAADGKAIRLMVAAGAGIPLHFLAEGESATRATAHEMGTATYRHFVHRQHVFESLLRTIIDTAALRAGRGRPTYTFGFEPVLADEGVAASAF